jgi:hypothetical protein
MKLFIMQNVILDLRFFCLFFLPFLPSLQISLFIFEICSVSCQC